MIEGRLLRKLRAAPLPHLAGQHAIRPAPLRRPQRLTHSAREHRSVGRARTRLCSLAIGLVVTGCHHLVEVRYTPSGARGFSTIYRLQPGSFRGEAQFEATPSRIERNGGESYELPVPVSVFLRKAFLAEINARWIAEASHAKRVDGQVLQFEFPWVEQLYFPSRARCSMSFRFTVRDGEQTLFEKVYEESIELGLVKEYWGKPQGEHVGRAFVQLLKRVFRSFLDDSDVVNLLNSSGPAPSSVGAQSTDLPL